MLLATLIKLIYYGNFYAKFSEFLFHFHFRSTRGEFPSALLGSSWSFQNIIKPPIKYSWTRKLVLFRVKFDENNVKILLQLSSSIHYISFCQMAHSSFCSINRKRLGVFLLLPSWIGYWSIAGLFSFCCLTASNSEKPSCWGLPLSNSGKSWK